jgi:hypothetical protein
VKLKQSLTPPSVSLVVCNDVQADYHINRVMMAVSSKELHSALEHAKAAQNNGADLGTKFVEKVSRDDFYRWWIQQRRLFCTVVSSCSHSATCDVWSVKLCTHGSHCRWYALLATQNDIYAGSVAGVFGLLTGTILTGCVT